ncbi:NifU N-terminal domain-containing protein [Sporosarcina sp. Marseille-Q4063]|uniref:NifU N-terminal domain-containing protein n=1 Tax=Sporosarcina sp. Marseille-Q4063 TaxID=2810514 RepID=UPI001BAE7A5F|nr:NifU N-terminal domain-containing protein [Sporosarcina sp. Marseille-Q4063]QUW22406.1 NifU N-terminal domain-containing protein [Sporosarcina sp. Marseille-Q4063]
MKIISIEATPNPNSMRVVFDTQLPDGTSHNYRKSDAETASEPAASLLKVDGINGIYHVMNFMAIEKDPSIEWETILADVEAIIPKK